MKSDPSETDTAKTDPAIVPVESWGWTPRQRVGLGIALGVLLTFIIIQFIRRPATIGEATVRDAAEAVPQRIDPNTATEQELSRLPQLGEALARRIVEYREARKPNSPDGIVFRQPSDLDAVPQIGPTLVERLAPFFEFPSERGER